MGGVVVVSCSCAAQHRGVAARRNARGARRGAAAHTGSDGNRAARRRQLHAQGQGGSGAEGGERAATVETILVPDPGPGRPWWTCSRAACAETDLHYRGGRGGNDFPTCWGTRAASVVSAVAEVAEVSVGDHVILNCARSAESAARAAG
ncbi:hypothetical protein QJS66_00540 [Kocuria rhizophila]|nr:hypothetical protein QJS66_00540 [Kocuria rhizophila]